MHCFKIIGEAVSEAGEKTKPLLEIETSLTAVAHSYKYKRRQVLQCRSVNTFGASQFFLNGIFNSKYRLQFEICHSFNYSNP